MCTHVYTHTQSCALHMHTHTYTHASARAHIHAYTHTHSPHLSLSFPQHWPQTCTLSVSILPGVSPAHPGLSAHCWTFRADSAWTQTRLYLLDEWISDFFREMGQHWAWLHFCVEAVVWGRVAGRAKRSPGHCFSRSLWEIGVLGAPATPELDPWQSEKPSWVDRSLTWPTWVTTGEAHPVGICDLVGNKVVIFTCERTDTFTADFVCSKGLGSRLAVCLYWVLGMRLTSPARHASGACGLHRPASRPSAALPCAHAQWGTCSRFAVLVHCTRPCLEPTSILASALLLKNIYYFLHQKVIVPRELLQRVLKFLLCTHVLYPWRAGEPLRLIAVKSAAQTLLAADPRGNLR